MRVIVVSMKSRDGFLGGMRSRALTLAVAAPAALSGAPGSISEAYADVPRHFTWKQGFTMQIDEARKTGNEHVDVFITFGNKSHSWLDLGVEHRTPSSFQPNPLQKWNFQDQVASSGKITSVVTTHTHHYNTPPSPADLNLMLRSELGNKGRRTALSLALWGYDLLPPSEMKAPEFTSVGLILNMTTNSGWQYQRVSDETIIKHFPNTQLPIPSLVKNGGDDLGEVSKRLEAAGPALLAFSMRLVATSNGDFESLMKNQDDARLFHDLARAYASVGIMLRYVPPTELERGPPSPDAFSK
jgi:hypothetical protein